jgi:acyl-CoA reductase-like NAD-dependent aldehyde dehydrogenase
MRERAAAIAALITQEEGKPLTEAASEANGLEALERYPNTRTVSIVGT